MAAQPAAKSLRRHVRSPSPHMTQSLSLFHECYGEGARSCHQVASDSDIKEVEGDGKTLNPWGVVTIRVLDYDLGKALPRSHTPPACWPGHRREDRKEVYPGA